MTKMKRTVQGSKYLLEIIGNHNWELYDVTDQPSDRAYKWDEINRMSSIQELEIKHQYLFIPRPNDGKTLRDTYEQKFQNEGLRPSLKIDDPNDDRWLCIETYHNPALFTRLFFVKEWACATSPDYMSGSDFVVIDYKKLVDTFSKFFDIVNVENVKPQEIYVEK